MNNPYGGPAGSPYQQPGPAQQPGWTPPGAPQGAPGTPPGPASAPPGQGAPAGPGVPMGPGAPMGSGAPNGPGAPMGAPAGPPPPPGMGRVVLHTKYFPLSFVLALFKPNITINGQPGPAGAWGENVIDLPPGQYHIQLHVPYLWKFGNAIAPVPVNPGQQVNVYYAAPAMPFGDGAIGPGPQEPPHAAVGWGVFIGSIGFVILMFLIMALILA